VSPTTIYNALHCQELVKEETLQRIHSLMEAYDYHPDGVARAMVRGKTDVLGVIVPQLEVPFYAKLASSIERAANTAGYSCFICQHFDDVLKENREVSLMRERRVDGVIVRVSAARQDARAYERLCQAKMPFVLVDRHLEGPDAHFVGSDDTESAAEIMDYLAAKGHKRIAFLAWQAIATWYGSRYEGYLEGLKRNGLPYDERYVRVVASEYGSGRDEAFEMLRQFGDERPTAIFAFNDTTALGAIKAIYEFGLKVPDDVAVVGFGGYRDTSLLPVSLMTVEQPIASMGHWAVQMLLDQIDKKNSIRGPLWLKNKLRRGGSA
jgi:DNA-binding LacI/PurR family transcriptional regulator